MLIHKGYQGSHFDYIGHSSVNMVLIAQIFQGSEYQLFSTSNVSIYKQLFKNMYFYDSDHSLNLVTEGNYAYIYFKSNLKTLVGTKYTTLSGETSLHVASEEFFPGGYAWAFPKVAYDVSYIYLSKNHKITSRMTHFVSKTINLWSFIQLVCQNR